MCSPRRRSTNVRSSPSGRTPGHTTTCLLIAKLHPSSRPSTLAKALHKYGRLVRTIYICHSVAGEELRWRVRRQQGGREQVDVA
jgi:TnpA family transposase